MRNNSLEGLRGAAALLVVLFHVGTCLPGFGAAKNGYLAVDLFFVLSGYVIAGAYSPRLRDGSQWWAFIVRRFGRLWPVHITSTALFYAVSFAIALLAHLNAVATLPSVREVLAIAFFTQGLNTFDHPIGNNFSWSAGDEFYVYILFGLLCLTMRGRARVAAFLALSLLGYAMAIWAALGPDACLTDGKCFSMYYRFGWTRCLVGFFAGALVAEFQDWAPLAALAGRVPQVLALGVALAFIAFADRIPGTAFAAPAVFVALIASLSRDSGPVARLFRSRIAQYLGRISYSLYLGHSVFYTFLFGVARVPTGVAAHLIEGLVFLGASFTLAHLLCRLIETPCRQRVNAWADRVFGSPSPSNPARAAQADSQSTPASIAE